MTTTTLVRRFKFGSTVLADPDPSLSPAQVLALYTPNYPFLAGARVDEPVVEGDTLVYCVSKPAATTKGYARKRASKAPSSPDLDALRAWAGQPDTRPAISDRWERVFAFTLSLSKEPARPLRDALLIPLA